MEDIEVVAAIIWFVFLFWLFDSLNYLIRSWKMKSLFKDSPGRYVEYQKYLREHSIVCAIVDKIINFINNKKAR